VRIAQHAKPQRRFESGSLGIRDALVVAAGSLTGQGPLDAGAGIQRRRMPHVQLGKFTRHQIRIGKSVEWVLLGETSDFHRLVDAGLDGLPLEIGAGRMPFAFTPENRDADRPVAHVLECLDFAQAHGDGQALTGMCGHFGSAGTGPAGTKQGPFNVLLELVEFLLAVDPGLV
jgi:hypothetical protein